MLGEKASITSEVNPILSAPSPQVHQNTGSVQCLVSGCTVALAPLSLAQLLLYFVILTFGSGYFISPYLSIYLFMYILSVQKVTVDYYQVISTEHFNSFFQNYSAARTPTIVTHTHLFTMVVVLRRRCINLIFHSLLTLFKISDPMMSKC